MVFLIKALQLILALSVLVLVHELGHFSFARLFGVRVHKFYMFFNPKFSVFRAKKIGGKWQFRFFAQNLPEHTIQAIDENGVPKTTKKGKPVMVPDDISKLDESDWRKYPQTTEWGIGWVPFGGYCAIAGMVDETTTADELPSEPERWEARSRPAWQRFLILIGGVLFNFIFATMVYAMLLFANGKEVLPIENATLGYKYSNIALQNGFEDGDIVIAVDNESVVDAQDVVTKIIIEGKQNISVLRSGSKLDFTLPKDFSEQVISSDDKQLMSIIVPFVIDSVMDGSVAAKSGLQKGDSIVSVNGLNTVGVESISEVFVKNANRRIAISYYRNQNLMIDSITPDTNGKIGVGLKPPYSIFKTKNKRYGFLASLPAGVRMGCQTMVSYVKQMRLVFTKAGAKSIGGFGSIGNLFPASWDWTIFWHMTALLSIILAFMNILPIPVLDGGYLLFIIYELITGKKPSDKFMEVSLNIGMFFIFALLIYANGNDLFKLFFD